MKPGPSELGSRREGTGNTGDREHRRQARLWAGGQEMHLFGGSMGQTAPSQLEMDSGVLCVFTSSLSLSIPLSENGPIMLYGKCG